MPVKQEPHAGSFTLTEEGRFSCHRLILGEEVRTLLLHVVTEPSTRLDPDAVLVVGEELRTHPVPVRLLQGKRERETGPLARTKATRTHHFHKGVTQSKLRIPQSS